MTLSSKKAVIPLAQPTFCFSCERFSTFCKEMQEQQAGEDNLGRRVTLVRGQIQSIFRGLKQNSFCSYEMNNFVGLTLRSLNSGLRKDQTPHILISSPSPSTCPNSGLTQINGSNNGSSWFNRLRLQDAISQQGQGTPRIIHVIFVCGVKYELSSSTIHLHFVNFFPKKNHLLFVVKVTVFTCFYLLRWHSGRIPHQISDSCGKWSLNRRLLSSNSCKCLPFRMFSTG